MGRKQKSFAVGVGVRFTRVALESGRAAFGRNCPTERSLFPGTHPFPKKKREKSEGAGMGLFGRLTGWDTQKEAHNAAVASHLVDHADTGTKQRLIECIIEMQHQIKGRYAGTEEQILADLNSQPRSVQMNFVALACNNLGVQPPVRGFHFNDVSNPYRAKDGDIEERIGFAVKWLKERFQATVTWPGNSRRVNFTEWLRGNSSIELSCPSCSRMLRAPSGKHLNVTCPVCKHSWTQQT